MKKKKILCFDLDNTISKTRKKFYSKSKPIKKAINLITQLYDEGYYIKIYTGRFMARNRGDLKKTYKQGYKITKKQLKSWNLKFDKLVLGKTPYDLFVDDRAYGYKKNWYLDYRKYLKKI